MPRQDEESSLDRFRSWYRLADRGALPEIERAVIGADYGANGYTTVDQADELIRRVAVGPGDRLLDVGTGRGWPALHIAHQTGCIVTGTDVPVEGLRVGAQRVASDGGGARAAFVCAAAEGLPFRAATFEAVVHTDVLC